MKRELKFRAWQESQNKMHQEIGLHPHIMTNHTMCDEDECGYVAEGTGKGEYTLYTHYDSWPIMQYAGLKDKNGVDIYEEDIVRGIVKDVHDIFNEKDFTLLDEVGVVKMKEGIWMLSNEKDEYAEGMLYRYDSIEVIGNIYQHKHLLA